MTTDHTDDYDYGIIGNGRTCALIDSQATVVFLCMPDFDSGTIFASVLDDEKGGHFGISMENGTAVSQQYERHTGILVTRFEGEDGAFDVIDFMARYTWDGRAGTKHDVSSDVIRVLNHRSGKPRIRIHYDPRLDYGRLHTESHLFDGGRIKSTTSGKHPDGVEIYESCYLYSDLDAQSVLDGDTVTLDQTRYLLLSYNDKVMPPDADTVHLMLQRTRSYWLLWSARTHRCSRYSEEILRSAITLKMMQFSPTGAVLAAGTTSLPETIGEERNWDYRFCWIRDGSMTVSVLHRIGHPHMAEKFIDWVMHTIPTKDDALQIMYGIRGEKILTEEALDHLSGYHGSSPVRIGNAAYHQKQHDIYGILMDVLHQDLEERRRTPESLDRIWTRVRSIVKSVEGTWKLPDRGIWEIRGEEKHFVFSKVLCWVAVDRAIRIAEMLDKHEWAGRHIELRDAIRADVMENGWDAQKQCFTQAYGTGDLDSANLLMAEYGFIDPRDPKFVSTVEQSDKELRRGGLMYRYRNTDDFGQPGSAFTVCSFWMVKALACIGRRREARQRFETLLSYANPKGLYGEDLDFDTKRQLGNFPQAYSHLALIDCALELAEDCGDYLIEA